MRENEDRSERKGKKKEENIYFVNRCRHALRFFKSKFKKKVLTAVNHTVNLLVYAINNEV